VNFESERKMNARNSDLRCIPCSIGRINRSIHSTIRNLRPKLPVVAPKLQGFSVKSAELVAPDDFIDGKMDSRRGQEWNFLY